MLTAPDAGRETKQPYAVTQSLTSVQTVPESQPFTSTPTIPFTRTPKPTSTLMPTSAPTESVLEYKDKWITFVDNKSGITFEYPAVYEHPLYAWCAPVISHRDGQTTIYIAAKHTWIIQSPKQKTAQEALDELKERDKIDDEFNIQDISQQEIFGSMGYVVEYRFGGLNRYGSASIVEVGDKLILRDFNAGPFCDVLEIDFYEQEAMLRFNETFRFVAPEIIQTQTNLPSSDNR